MNQLIITAVGPDRPGIVGELTGYLHQAGANLLDSRMVNLRGQFALVILFEIATDAQARLRADLPGTAKAMGLTISIADQNAPPARVEGLRYRLKTYSLDQPGIVARLTNLLREFGVNIEELSAWQESAPFGGEALFLCEMRLTVPGEVKLANLRNEITRLCSELNCDVDLEPDEPASR